MVDGPGARRQVLNVKALHLTKYVLKIQHGVRVASLKKAWAKAEIDKKWAESSWAKRLAAKQRRSALTDFERFKLMKAKQAVSFSFSERTVKFDRGYLIRNNLFTEKPFDRHGGW